MVGGSLPYVGRRTRGTGIKNGIGNHTFRTTSRRQDEMGYIPQAVDGRATVFSRNIRTRVTCMGVIPARQGPMCKVANNALRQ